MKAHRSTLAALRTAERRAEYRVRSRSSLLIDLGAHGVPFAALATLADRIGLPLEDVLAVAGIAARTAARRRTERFLKPDEADRVLRIARVVEESARVLGGYGKAGAWLRTPHPLLSGERPFVLLGSDAGAKAVSDELVRIDYGDFA